MNPASFDAARGSNCGANRQHPHTRATVNNVLAYLPGKTDEYVIIGAHYDHLGRGNFDSLAPSQIGQIHPGADDNASGTAGVLELARLLAPQKGQLRRGILFMSFAGEELGLLGSAEWVKNPTRPLDKAVAMLNMDMIGRIKDDKVYIGGVGTGSTLKAAVEQAAEKSGFKIEYSASDILPAITLRLSQENSGSVFLSACTPTITSLPIPGRRSIGSGDGACWRGRDDGELLADAEERPAFIVVAETNRQADRAAAATARTSDRSQISARSNRREVLRREAGSPAAKAA